MRLTYRSALLLLRPDTERVLASVSLEIASSEQYNGTFLMLRRFLSAVTWGSRCGFREQGRLGGGSALPDVGRGPQDPYVAPRHPRAHPLWAPEPSDPRALLALTLFREGIVERNPVFQYLSFFKVLEVVVLGRDRIVGLAAKHLGRARQKAALMLDPAERPTGSDAEVALNLYQEGRCAIAHAHSQPLIDPDDPQDTRDIAIAVPLVRSLAEVVIECELGVPRWPPANWRPEWSRIATQE